MSFTETVTTELSHLSTVIHSRSNFVRVRDAFLRLSLVVDNHDFGIDAHVTRALEVRESNFTVQQRNLLIALVRDGRLFSRIRNITRVGSFTVNPLTGLVTKKGLAESARLLLLRIILTWNDLFDFVRTNEALREQADMGDSGEFVYRTLLGARFPPLLSSQDVEACKGESGDSRYTLHTDFSSWTGTGAIHEYMIGGEENYSTSASESLSTYAPRVVSLHVGKVVGKVEVPIMFATNGHSAKRVVQYGLSCTHISFVNSVIKATISGGRSVPAVDAEDKRGTRSKDSTRKIQFEINSEDLLIYEDVSKPGGGKLKAKVIMAAYVNPQVGIGIDAKPALMSEYLDQSNPQPLEVSGVWIMTIIPIALPEDKPRLRTTGLPPLPWFLKTKGLKKAVSLIGRLPYLIDGDLGDVESKERLTMLSDNFDLTLTYSDQWLNIKRSEIESFLISSGCESQFKERRFVQITKCGVEFDEAEYLRDEHPSLYDSILHMGYNILYYQLFSDGDSRIIQRSDVPDMWEEYFSAHQGPSIVHSEEIRSNDQNFGGTKPVTAPLLLVRIVLSRLLVVGVGNIRDHGPMNPLTLPNSAHLLNKKRVEAMLVPCSVLKDAILVYSIGSASAKVLQEVALARVSGNIVGDIMQASVQFKDGKRVSKFDTMNTQPLFTVTAPIIKISRDALLGDSRGLWLISPSGVEFDVSPIASDICMQLKAQAKYVSGSRSRAVIAWHPLFCIVVGMTAIKKFGSDQKYKFDVIILPARRASSIATSYHNTSEVTRALDFTTEVNTHYATIREEGGYVGGLRNFLINLSSGIFSIKRRPAR